LFPIGNQIGNRTAAENSHPFFVITAWQLKPLQDGVKLVHLSLISGKDNNQGIRKLKQFKVTLRNFKFGFKYVLLLLLELKGIEVWRSLQLNPLQLIADFGWNRSCPSSL
jgi:hypothetical protein